MENYLFILNSQFSILIMLKLELVTHEKKVVYTEADLVTIPTASGEAGIMPNHAPLISALKPGILAYTNRGATERVAIAGGFVEVSNDKVSVLADSAETAGQIDMTSARADLEAAQKAIAAAAMQPIEENESLREQLDSANARLQLAAGK
jgi:F-type H+-transporting ATPase subunit epsilon